jgi:endonuclease/exonuclease/phosphatase family metal-dependent hydrolase
MEYNIRTWNMNYWKKRKGDAVKTSEEKYKWGEYAEYLINKDNYFDFFLLQETSFNMFSGEKIENFYIDDNNFIHANFVNNDVRKHIIYNTNPKKYLSWGNMIIQKCTFTYKDAHILPNFFNNTLTYQCLEFPLIPLTFINVHLQKDFKTKMYYTSLQKLINEIKTLINNSSITKNSPILLVGDFNASDKFSSGELENFKKAFIEIKEMGFVDCTESIDLDKRSTMVDYEFQNDYVFVNEPYYKNIKNVVIRKDIVSEYIDHYPVDFQIEI